jgi:hypothetical protein
MKFKILMVLMFAATIFLSANLYAQDKRHPRVSELEKSLSHEGLELLKGRFPDKPFLIKVKIEPLFRERLKGGANGEKLPYLDIVDDEIIDEWDDPAAQQGVLLDRVKRIYVNASVPQNLTEDELTELKETLLSNLGMVSGRDTVEITKRSWGSSETETTFNRNSITWTIVGFVLFCLGLLGAAWLNTSRLSQAFKSQKPQSDKPAQSAAPPMQAPAEATRAPTAGGGGAGSVTGDVRFSDPLKTREMIAQGIRTLESQKGFPSLEDMEILQRFGESKPRELGALIYEFPPGLREKVFSYSRGEFWLYGLSDPSEVSSSSVEVINKCLRVQHKESESQLEELKILIWRLDDKSAEFFRGIDQTEAFSLMFDLPKKISLTIARGSFPGSWGTLLNPNFKPQPISNERIAELRKRTLELLDLRDLNSLSKFKKESDLLDFLRVSDPHTEKEIYVAAGSGSMLATIRPPFYKIFEMSDAIRERLAGQMRVEDWAVALFNVNRDQRRLIESFFGDKQKFRFLELMKSFDRNPPPVENAGDLRARAGRFGFEIEKKIATEAAAAVTAAANLSVAETPKAA